MLFHVTLPRTFAAGLGLARLKRGMDMTAMVGGDLEQLQVLEQEFRADAQAVVDLRARISSVLAGTAWTGPAANQFREEWQGTFSTALNQLSAALTQNAALVANRRQAIFAATA